MTKPAEPSLHDLTDQYQTHHIMKAQVHPSNILAGLMYSGGGRFTIDPLATTYDEEHCIISRVMYHMIALS